MAALSQVLADFFAVFASPKAQDEGVQFDPELCAIWAQGLREMVNVARALEQRFSVLEQERDQLLAIAGDADLIAHAKAGAPRREPMLRVVDNVVEMSPSLRRNAERQFAPLDGGAA